MSEVIVKDNIQIENLIYEIRGKQVMLDFDLARLYGCKNGTKSLNLAVKRNIERFPEDFYFQIDKNEYDNLKFQFETSSLNMYGGVRKLPYVFTEQGVAMLSAVLKTDVAEEVSIKIMDAFVAMKKIISNLLIEQKYINSLVLEYDGQIYDAYSLLINILGMAKKKTIIIDNYAGKEFLYYLNEGGIECQKL